MRKILFILLFAPIFTNAITPVFTCGFECGRLGTNGEHFSTTGGTISTSTVRNGARSLSISNSTSQNRATTLTLSSSAIWVIRVYVNFSSLPTSDHNLLVSVAGSFNVGARMRNDNTIYANAGTTVVGDGGYGASGVVVTTGQWYRLDIKVDMSNNPWSVDVSVDGVACGQATAARAASSATVVNLATVAGANVTYTALYDDFIVSNTGADFPIGAGYVNHFVPTSDGTHNVAGANDFEFSATGTDILNSTTTAYTLLDDVPMEQSGVAPTDYINLIAPPNATDYVECIFGPASGISTPTTAPRAVQATFVIAASATGTNNIRIALNDNGSTDDVFNGAYAVTVSTNQFKTKLYIDPPSAATSWTLSGNGNFNNIRVRCYTNDAAPDPFLVSAMIEAEFEEISLTVPGTPSDKRHTTLGVGKK